MASSLITDVSRHILEHQVLGLDKKILKLIKKELSGISIPQSASSGGGVHGLKEGHVLFGSPQGKIQQESADLYWNASDDVLSLGTTSPYQTAKLFIDKQYTNTNSSQNYGVFVGATANPSGASSAAVNALGFIATTSGSNSFLSVNGIYGFATGDSTASGTQVAGGIFLAQLLNTGSVTAMYGNSSGIGVKGTGSPTIVYDYFIAPPEYTSTGRAQFHFGLNISNLGYSGQTASAGIYIDDQSGSTAINAAIYTVGGSVSFNNGQTSTADFQVLGDNDAELFYIDVSADANGFGTNSPSSSYVASFDGTNRKKAAWHATREGTATTVNNVGGYASTASTITVTDASGFAVNDKVCIMATVSNAISFTWYEAIFNLTVQSISGNDITFTTTIGKQGCNNSDRVVKQDMTHTMIYQSSDTGYWRYIANWQDPVYASINAYETGLGINTSEGYAASGTQVVDKDGKLRIWMDYGKLQLTKSDGVGVGINTLRGVGGFSVNDTRLLDAGTGRLRQLASLAEDGLRVGMPMTDAGADDVFQQSRGGSIQVVGDSTGRDAFRVNHNTKYDVTIGSTSLGSATASPSSSITAGATTVSLNASTIEPRYGFTFLGNFTTGATVTITEAAKATTTSVITINREACTLTLTTPAADNYTTAAVITQLPYSPDFTMKKGNGGGTMFKVTGETGALSLIADQTTNTAPNDDTTLKKLTLQKLAAAPTNAAYIAFTNNPGADNFYLVLEEG